MSRPRKFNPKIPAHIDPKASPRGVYWDATGNGRWYLLEHPRKAVTVAGPKALLSDIHAIAEARNGAAAKGTVGYVMPRFEESTTFTGMASGTQKGYRHQRKLVESYRTNLGVTLDQLAVARLGPAAIQRVVESIARERDSELPMPAKANHLLRHLRRIFASGVQHGHCFANPASGVAQAKERGKIKMPSPSSYARLLEFARERGKRDAHTAGSVAPYLAHLMVIAYSCRLRGIEVVTLTEANASEQGILSNRRKAAVTTLPGGRPRCGMRGTR